MLRRQSNIILNRAGKIIEPTSIPKYINQLDKPYIYHHIFIKRNKKSDLNKHLPKHEQIYYIDICRFKQQILPEGFPKSPLIGWAGLIDMPDGRGVRYARGYPGGTFELIEPEHTYIRWRNKTGIPVKMHLNIDKNKTTPYKYYCRNEVRGFHGFCIMRKGEESISRGLYTVDLPSSKYVYPIIIQDCTFYTDGSFSDTGEVIVVNGKAWPNLNVKRRQYRFYIMNGCAARHLSIMLSNELSITVIGRDGGLLSSPETRKEIPLAPGKIVDILIDFSGQPKGEKIILFNRAGSPYSDGYAANPETSGQIMRFLIPENDALAIKPVKLPDKLSL